MEIRRAIPALTTTDPEATRAFYQDFLGFRLAMEQDGMYLFISITTPTTQLMVTWDSLTAADPAVLGVDVSLEVADAAKVHARAIAQQMDIVYPLTDEPWGIRRFFLRDPTGRVINVASHLDSERDDGQGHCPLPPQSCLRAQGTAGHAIGALGTQPTVRTCSWDRVHGPRGVG